MTRARRYVEQSPRLSFLVQARYVCRRDLHDARANADKRTMGIGSLLDDSIVLPLREDVRSVSGNISVMLQQLWKFVHETRLDIILSYMCGTSAFVSYARGRPTMTGPY